MRTILSSSSTKHHDLWKDNICNRNKKNENIQHTTQMSSKLKEYKDFNTYQA